MSNVEPEQPGVIDAALLARLVPVYTVATPDAINGATGEGATLLNRKDAVSRVRSMLRDLFPVEEPSFWDSIGQLVTRGSFAGGAANRQERPQRALDAAAELIVDAIPEEVRSDRLIAQINVIPYMQQLVANESAVFRTADGEGHRVSDIQDVVTAGVLVAQDKAATTQQGTALAPGSMIDPATGELMFQTPGQAVQTGASAMDVRLTQRYNQIPFDGLPLQVDLTGVVQPMRPGRTPGAQFGGFVPDAVTGAQMPTSVPSSVMPPGVTGRSGIVNAKQAADFLYSLSPQEVEQLQDRMRAAGYFTEIGFDQNTGQQAIVDVPFEAGYSDDQATSSAWIKVIADSLGEQRSVDELLRNKSMDFERRRQSIVQDVRAQRTTAFAGALSNVRDMADQFAIETLGRRLSPEEFVDVRQYVRTLQNRRVGQIAGNVMEPWMEEAPTMGFTEKELMGSVREQLVETEMAEPGGNIWSRLARKYLDDGTP